MAGSSREIAAKRSRFEQVYANPDGTETTAFSQLPVNYRRPDGTWAPIDVRLNRDTSGGGWVADKDEVTTRIADGLSRDAPVASVTLDDGHEVAWGVETSAAVPGTASAQGVSFREFAKDADLRLESRPGGVKESIVLRSAAAPTSYLFPLRLKGLTAKLAGGEVQLVDEKQATRAVIPAGFMIDSARSGPAMSAAVRYSLVDLAGGGRGLRVDVDQAWLRDPHRVFPVKVDPTVATASSTAAITVREHDVLSGNENLQVGCLPPEPDRQDCTASGTERGYAYLAFPNVTTALAHERILGAKLALLNWDSGSCTPREISVHEVRETWSLTNASWPGPAVGPAFARKSFNHGFMKVGSTKSACPYKYEPIDLHQNGRDVIQAWVDGSRPNYGLSVRGSVTDKTAWKMFTGTQTANPPRLYITHTPYDATYKVQKMLTPVTETVPGQFSIRVTNHGADGFPWTPGRYYLGYRLWDAKTRQLLDSMTVASQLSSTVAHGQSATLTATVQPLAGTTSGRQYFVDFTMVDGTRGKVFTDEFVPPARMQVTVYKSPPFSKRWWPVNGFQSPTLTPTLSVTAQDLDAPASELTFKFEICESVPGNDRLNCVFSGTGDVGSYRTASVWTVPAGTLSWNKKYKWRVYVKDGAGNNEPTQPAISLLTNVPQPVLTSHIANSPEATGDHPFDPQVGNYTASAVDATIPVPGPALNVLRTYNSLDPRRTSVFGAGWTSLYDAFLRQEAPAGESGNALITYPDGQQVRFGLNPDGKWVAPPDRKATLTKETNGEWTLRGPGGIAYRFRTDGRLSQVIQPASKPLVLMYGTDGKLASVVSQQGGGRKLTFTWTTPAAGVAPHVASVSTDPVNGAPLTWTYEYAGDVLTKACDPRASCTSYESSAGSHYRSVVLDSRPESYWRLGDQAADPASSEVDVNFDETDDDGTYVGSVDYGRPGALAGTTDTSVYLGQDGFGTVQVKKSQFKRMSDGAVEVWFRTNSLITRPLLGYQSKPIDQTPTSSAPILYIGNDGKLRGQFWNGAATPITTTQTVNDNQWHHVVLSVAGTTQTMYLDSVRVGIVSGRPILNDALIHNQWGAANLSNPAGWPAYGSAQKTNYGGWMDEAAVYSHSLSSEEVSAHYRARLAADQLSKVIEPSGKVRAAVGYDAGLDRVSRYTDADGGTWVVGAPVTDGGNDDLRRTVELRDPANRVWFYEYDALAGWLLRSGRPNGLGVRPEDLPLPEGEGDFEWHSLEGIVVKSYTHDIDGHLTTVTDEVGDQVKMTYDARGNIANRTTCRQAGTECYTARSSYYTSGLTDPFDPRWDLLLDTRDGRSASATDNTYQTTRTYATSGAVASVTDPSGLSSTFTYTAGNETAPGGGTMPPGLLKEQTNVRGAKTTFSYNSSGMLAEVLAPSGARTSYTYDAIGRRSSQTVKVAGRPDATTTYEYDKASNVAAVVGPKTTDAVSGAQHQQRAELSYDIDGNTVTITVKDLLDPGAEPRVTTQGYDDFNRLEQVVDPDGGETSFGYDEFGNKTSMVDAAGNHYEYAYTARNMLAEVRLDDADSAGEPGYSVIESRGYDQTGRQVRQGDALGRNIRYLYNGDSTLQRSYLQAFHNPDGTTRDYTLEQNTFDAAGNLITRVSDNGTLTESFKYDNSGRRIEAITNPGTGPGIVSRTTHITYGTNGDLTEVTETGTPSGVSTSAQTATTDFAYDLATGQLVEQKVQVSAAPDPVEEQVTRWTYDQAGQALTVTQPRGNTTATPDEAYTTHYSYDELGRQVKVEAPPVATEANGGAPVTSRPTTLVGYDGFGEPVATKDPLGNVSRTSYNKRGLVVEQVAPAYTPPSGSTAVTPTTRLGYDAIGQMTELTDPRGNVTRYGYDRLGHRTSVDTAANTNDDRAVWSYSYLRNGLLASAIDPNGAEQRWTYDDLDRQITATEVERRPTLANLVTKTSWDDANNPVASTSPTGAVTTNNYDALGQLTKSTDPNGVATSFGYDSAGRAAQVTDGLGRAVRSAYDLAGQLVSATTLDKDGNALGTVRYGYDLDGNQVTSTTASSHSTTTTFDALGQVTRLMEPTSASASITTTYGYDAAGNRSRITDGRGNATQYTTNVLGLPEKVIEPSTAAHPALNQRTWTASYDAAGNPAVLDAPGGVRRTRDFDAANRLVTEEGVQAESATTTRTLGYDHADQLTSASAPGGTDLYTYNDRGLLLTASGPSGDASYTYNDDGDLTTRVDAAGTADFAYTKGRLSSVTDPITRVSQAIGYNTAGQLASVDYGAGRVRTIGYDAFGRLASDTLKNSAGSTAASVSYGYDVDDQVSRKTTTGVAGAGDNTYTYDYLGRLSAWTAGGQTTEYGWDEASNRTRVTTPSGTKTASYDERNRLLSDGTWSYSYTARGTLSSKTDGTAATASFTFDAFDRLITAGSRSQAYDALDRPVSNGTAAFKYAGLDMDAVSDGTQSYGHGLSGGVLSVAQDTTNRLVLADKRGDIVGGFDPADTTLTALSDSRTYDPFGQVLGAAGTRYGVGYQGDWTDPVSGQVNMGARWYDPASGGFISRDTLTYPSGIATNLTNLYGYGGANPLSYTDPTGHINQEIGGRSSWCPPGTHFAGGEKCVKDSPPPPPPPGGEDHNGAEKPKPGTDPGNNQNTRSGNTDDGNDRGNDDRSAGDHKKTKPSKPKCDPECLREKQRQQDLRRTQGAKDKVEKRVNKTPVPVPGGGDLYCPGSNPTCKGVPATQIPRPGGPVVGFSDNSASATARETAVKTGGPVTTSASTQSNGCIFCIGVGLDYPGPGLGRTEPPAVDWFHDAVQQAGDWIGHNAETLVDIGLDLTEIGTGAGIVAGGVVAGGGCEGVAIPAAAVSVGTLSPVVVACALAAGAVISGGILLMGDGASNLGDDVGRLNSPGSTGARENPRFDGEAGNYSDDELAEFAYGHSGQGYDEQGKSRPTRKEILDLLSKGKPTWNRETNSWRIENARVRIFINKNSPWKSTAYYKDR